MPMASYTLQGDEFLGKITWGGIKKSLAKVDPTSKKNWADASKTVARFDPTSSTAKYGSAVRTGLAITGAVAAAALTAGLAAPALAAVGITGATATAAGAGGAALIGGGVKAITGPAAARQAQREMEQQTSQPTVKIPDTTQQQKDKDSGKKSPVPIALVAGVGLVVLAGLYFASK